MIQLNCGTDGVACYRHHMLGFGNIEVIDISASLPPFISLDISKTDVNYCVLTYLFICLFCSERNNGIMNGPLGRG